MNATTTGSGLPPLGLYVHFPWCVRKCPYCDFNSYAADGEIPESRYLDALEVDLARARAGTETRPLTCVFLGGGTPSLFQPETIFRLIEHLRAHGGLADDAEITLEANPGTLEHGRFEGYRQAGVTRLSIGVQSFDDTALARLGRIHGGDDAHAAIEAARTAGFEHINADLMHGLPGQNATQAAADVDRAIAAGVDHVSFYQLTIEPNTAFYRQPPRLPDEDTLADIEEHGFERLESADFARYEVSAWARRDAARCQHNLNYWTFGDYLGIGAGAHGKVTTWNEPQGLTVARCRRTRAPRDYLGPGGTRPAAIKTIPAEELPGEFMMNALRLTDGVADSLFEAHTGQSLATIAATRERLVGQGLMRADRLAATPRGFDFLNRLIAAFLA